MGAVSEPAAAARPRSIAIRRLGCQPFEPVWRAMQTFSENRGPDSGDELWLLEHPPVYTLGLNGRAQHVVAPGAIPVLRIDRGGQVTYHGPGQLVGYLLLDLERLGLGVRQLVRKIEQALVDLLARWDIASTTREGAPGVYVGERKIAAIGLRVRRGRCYHGLALNVDMDLSPYAGIHPCGYRELAVTQLKELGGPTDLAYVGNELAGQLGHQLGISPVAADPATAPPGIERHP